MKLILKRIDLYGQAVIPLCYLFASGGNIIYTFLLVIACHIVSCVINELLLNNDYKSAVRRTYEIILVIFGALFFFTYPRDLVIFEKFTENVDYKLIIMLLVLLFSPVMAIMYFMISVEEIGIIDDEIKSDQRGR